MKKIKDFIKKHPAWSIFILIVFIISSLYLSKLIYPNKAYDDLYYNNIKYECLDDRKWELLETPDCPLGKYYKHKCSLIPMGNLCSFENDPEKIFIKDVGPTFLYSYVREDKKPNLYDSTQIEAIGLELGDINRSTIEIKKEEDIKKFVSFVESIENNQIKKSEMPEQYSNKVYLNLKIKNHPVIYKAGKMFRDEKTGRWIIRIGLITPYDKNYYLPEELSKILMSNLNIEQ